MAAKPNPESRPPKARMKTTATKQRPAGSRRQAAAPMPERRRAIPAEKLATELLSVKKALDGTVARLRVRVWARFAEVLSALDGIEPPSKGTVKDMILKIREVKLKPEKGRIKDLLRLQLLGDDLVKLLGKG